MFITKQELCSAISDYQLAHLQFSDAQINKAILAAVGEATAYLNSKYDCTTIFNAQGDDRNAVVLEKCVSIAVWYLIRTSNADIIYERARDYYTQAIDWFKLVAGVDSSGRTIAPDLPVRKTEGEITGKMRFGSARKFSHTFDD